MNKCLIVLLTCILPINLYGKNNEKLGLAIQNADLTTFNNLFKKNLFLQKQASVNDTFGDMPVLNFAIESYINPAKRGNQNIKKMIEFLIKNNAPLNSTSQKLLYTPLREALGVFGEAEARFKEIGQIEDLKDIIKLLLQYGADTSIKDKRGNTPLHIATKNESSEITKLLLKSGAKTDIENDEGLTIQKIVEHSQDDEIKEIFNKHLQEKTGLYKVLQAEKDKPKKSTTDLEFRFE